MFVCFVLISFLFYKACIENNRSYNLVRAVYQFYCYCFRCCCFSVLPNRLTLHRRLSSQNVTNILCTEQILWTWQLAVRDSTVDTFLLWFPPRNRLEEDLYWIVCHVHPTPQLVKELNWTDRGKRYRLVAVRSSPSTRGVCSSVHGRRHTYTGLISHNIRCAVGT